MAQKIFDGVQIHVSFAPKDKYADLTSKETLGNLFGQIQTNMNYLNNKEKELTQAEYDALTDEKKNDGTIQYIKDGEGTISNPDNYYTKEEVDGLIPTRLPADGGNADTLDDKHAVDFCQVNALTHLEIPLADAVTPGTYGCFVSWSTDYPASYGDWGYLNVLRFGNVCFQLLMTSNGNFLFRQKIIDQTDWTEWADLTNSPAKGGNADTVDGLHANEIASNPNLLINPDFKINQRGQTEQEFDLTNTSVQKYCVDHWFTRSAASKIILVDNGIKIGFSGKGTIGSNIEQAIENFTSFIGQSLILSVKFQEIKAQGAQLASVVWLPDGTYKSLGSKKVTQQGVNTLVLQPIPSNATKFWIGIYGADQREGDTIDSYSIIEWAKLESGSVATPFTPPDPATELLKCQRYYFTTDMHDPAVSTDVRGTYSVSSINGGYGLANVRFPVTMRRIPTVTLLSADRTKNRVSAWDSNLTIEDVAAAQDTTISTQGFTNIIVGSLTRGAVLFHVEADAEI